MKAPTAHQCRVWLYSVLCVSAAARLALIASGGQQYWPDEAYYDGVIARLATGDIPGALALLHGPGHHFVFRIAWIVPDALGYVTGVRRAPVAAFGMLSVVSIWLLWRIARRMGASEFQAVAAATLLAGSVTFFYYSRHLLPYDLAMALALAGLYAATRTPARARDSVASGVFATLAFLAYAGYWTMLPAVLAAHVSCAPARAADMLRRITLFGVGALVMLGLTEAALAGLTGQGVIIGFLSHSSTITQGNFGEGWRLPFEYLWHAEHLLAVLWLAAIASALWHARTAPVPPMVRLALLSTALIYAGFVFTSTWLERFVVYGRLVRQLVPFACLVAACELDRLRASVGVRRAAAAGAMLVLGAQVATNFWQPFRLTFPREFENVHQHRVVDLAPEQYVWVNVGHIYPAPKPAAIAGDYTEIAYARHPLQFVPYLYEGYTPAQRAVLRSSDLTMRLLVREPPAAEAVDPASADLERATSTRPR